MTSKMQQEELRKCIYRKRIILFIKTNKLSTFKFCIFNKLNYKKVLDILNLRRKISFEYAYLLAKATKGESPAIDMLIESEFIWKNRKQKKDFYKYQLNKNPIVKLRPLKIKKEKIDILNPY